MSMKRTAFVFAAALGAFVLGAEVHAQDNQPPAAPQDAELVFEREVFDYPSFTRRNPFRPLSGPGGELRFARPDGREPRLSPAFISLGDDLGHLGLADLLGVDVNDNSTAAELLAVAALGTRP